MKASYEGYRINDLVQGLKAILKSAKSLEKMAEQDPLQFPAGSLVCGRIKEEDQDETIIYQGAAVDSYTGHSINHYTEQALEDLRKLEEKIKESLQQSDTTILRAILVFFDTQSWSCQDGTIDIDLTEIKSAVEILISKFREPLQAKGATLAGIQGELEEVVEYGRKYLSLDKDSYHRIWYKLHTASDPTNGQMSSCFQILQNGQMSSCFVSCFSTSLFRIAILRFFFHLSKQ